MAEDLWTSGERVPPEAHNTLYLELLSAYAFAEPLFSGATLLDIGCSAGYGTARLASAGRRVVGIDYDPRVAAEARRQYGAPGVGFLCADGTRLPVRSGSVDGISAFQVIEHLADQERFVEELARVLRPGGVAVLSTPNAVTHVGPRNPHHVRELRPEELRALLGGRFAFVELAGQVRPGSVYTLEAACRPVRRWDVLGLRHRIPRPLVSRIVAGIARLRGLTPPQALPLSAFRISPEVAGAYNLFAVCSDRPDEVRAKVGRALAAGRLA